jgi:hypothetical protein
MRARGGNPFVSHAFPLRARGFGQRRRIGRLAAGADRDRRPDGRPAGVLPAYAKSHSQGEYVFDHGWADAWERAGGQYYPKLQIAVPFLAGPRAAAAAARSRARAALIAAIEAVVGQNGLSSAHATFIDARPGAAVRGGGLADPHRQPVPLAESGYRASTISSARCQPQAQGDPQGARGGGGGAGDRPPHRRRDHRRRIGTRSGISIRIPARANGAALSHAQFFSLLGERMADKVLLMLALRDGQPIAGALNLIGGDALYGRYWGCVEEVPFLHFELCYYQAIDAAIARGLPGSRRARRASTSWRAAMSRCRPGRRITSPIRASARDRGFPAARARSSFRWSDKGSSSVTRRFIEPGACLALCLGDLACAHFLGDLGAPVLRLAAAAQRREVEPFMRLDQIDDRVSRSRRIGHAQFQAGIRIAAARFRETAFDEEALKLCTMSHVPHPCSTFRPRRNIGYMV